MNKLHLFACLVGELTIAYVFSLAIPSNNVASAGLALLGFVLVGCLNVTAYNLGRNVNA